MNKILSAFLVALSLLFCSNQANALEITVSYGGYTASDTGGYYQDDFLRNGVFYFFRQVLSDHSSEKFTSTSAVLSVGVPLSVAGCHFGMLFIIIA